MYGASPPRYYDQYTKVLSKFSGSDIDPLDGQSKYGTDELDLGSSEESQRTERAKALEAEILAGREHRQNACLARWNIENEKVNAQHKCTSDLVALESQVKDQMAIREWSQEDRELMDEALLHCRGAIHYYTSLEAVKQYHGNWPTYTDIAMKTFTGGDIVDRLNPTQDRLSIQKDIALEIDGRVYPNGNIKDIFCPKMNAQLEFEVELPEIILDDDGILRTVAGEVARKDIINYSTTISSLQPLLIEDRRMVLKLIRMHFAYQSSHIYHCTQPMTECFRFYDLMFSFHVCKLTGRRFTVDPLMGLGFSEDAAEFALLPELSFVSWVGAELNEKNKRVWEGKVSQADNESGKRGTFNEISL